MYISLSLPPTSTDKYRQVPMDFTDLKDYSPAPPAFDEDAENVIDFFGDPVNVEGICYREASRLAGNLPLFCATETDAGESVYCPDLTRQYYEGIRGTIEWADLHMKIEEEYGSYVSSAARTQIGVFLDTIKDSTEPAKSSRRRKSRPVKIPGCGRRNRTTRTLPEMFDDIKESPKKKRCVVVEVDGVDEIIKIIGNMSVQTTSMSSFDMSSFRRALETF